jgi:hypothetical protein
MILEQAASANKRKLTQMKSVRYDGLIQFCSPPKDLPGPSFNDPSYLRFLRSFADELRFLG